MKKLELEWVSPQDPRWWSKTVAKMAEINKFIKANGKGFYKVTTFEGESFHMHLSEAKDAILDVRFYSLVDYITVQRLRAIVKDEQAEKDYKKLATEDERDQYLKKWHGLGSKWIRRGSIGVIS